MGMFSKILGKLGFPTAAAASPAPASNAPPSRAPASPPPPAPRPAVAAPPVAPTATPAPRAISPVDVTAQLEKLSAANGQTLNWRTSIVDLLKLLDIDSSLAARKELATELHCPADLMGDSANMNMWLHKTVLRKIAENGGNVPTELTD